MARRLDKIVVVDFEATCWAAEDTPPPGAVTEIIEAGFCLVDVETLDVSELPTSWFVQPKLSKVDEYCTKLTTITQEQVDGGYTFIEVCSGLNDLGERGKRLWASYGDYDRIQLERQCEREKVMYPFGRTHLNVKTLVAVMAGWNKEVGMDEALRRLKLPLVGTHHRAGDDARNIARILSVVMEAGRVSIKHIEGLGEAV